MKGFKRLFIRVHDGAQPVLDKNLFVIEGKPGKGATQTANISGLSSEPVKTYGSNIAYYVANRGVGDLQVEFGIIDLPYKVEAIILGQKINGNTIKIGADTVAPYCSILMESSIADGTPAFIGCYNGQFSRESVEFETEKDSQEELTADSLKFSAIASTDANTEGLYVIKHLGNDEQELNAIKAELKMVNAA
ncbi:major tail protein [Streptococcus danieliae]|uniref:major tail protein n=1 Tax=Streptococcus danieliae TaxID=747656 RepID=UPI0021C8D349|nr:major tail protein [Streptococcus danieliae]MCU0082167.1 phage tail protein [Streptococcus danieliae]